MAKETTVEGIRRKFDAEIAEQTRLSDEAPRLGDRQAARKRTEYLADLKTRLGL